MNVQWIEGQCIFKAALRDCADVHPCVWNGTVHLLLPYIIQFPHFILPCRLNPDYFLYTRVELKLPKTKKKKNKTRMYAKHSDAFCTILGQTAICTYSKLMNTFFLFTNHFLRHCFSSFWVTVALFVLCPFVKLFLNVYTWFSDCLFCTFKFIIKQFKLSPWCLEDHIV